MDVAQCRDTLKCLDVLWRYVRSNLSAELRSYSRFLFVPLVDEEHRVHFVSVNSNKPFISASYGNQTIPDPVCLFLGRLGVVVVRDRTIIDTLMSLNSVTSRLIHQPDGILDILREIASKNNPQYIRSRILKLPQDLQNVLLQSLIRGYRKIPQQIFSFLSIIGFKDVSEGQFLEPVYPQHQIVGRAVSDLESTSPRFLDYKRRNVLISKSGSSLSFHECIDPNDMFMNQLFSGLDVFIDERQYKPNFIESIRKIGFKTREKITAVDVVKIISSAISSPIELYCQKIENLLLVLKSNTKLLFEKVDKQELQTYLVSAKWLRHANHRPSKYPSALLWHGGDENRLYAPCSLQQEKYSYFVGSVLGVHIFDFSPELAFLLSIDTFPPFERIFEHYQNIINLQGVVESDIFEDYITIYYTKLVSHIQNGLIDCSKHFPKNWLWNGYHFVDSKTHCLYLTTFLSPFTTILRKNAVMYKETVHGFSEYIKNKYSNKSFNILQVQTDLSLIFSSLQDLIDHTPPESVVEREQLLVPVESNVSGKITLVSVKEFIEGRTSPSPSFALHSQFPDKLLQQLDLERFVKTTSRIDKDSIRHISRQIFRLAEYCGSSTIKIVYDRKISKSLGFINHLFPKCESLWIYYSSAIPCSNFEMIHFLKKLSQTIFVASGNKMFFHDFCYSEKNLEITPEITVLEDIFVFFKSDSEHKNRNDISNSGTLIFCPLENRIHENSGLKKVISLLFQNIIKLSVKAMLYLDVIYSTSMYYNCSDSIHKSEIVFNLTKYISSVMQPTLRTKNKEILVPLSKLKSPVRQIISLYQSKGSFDEEENIVAISMFDFKGVITKLGSKLVGFSNIKNIGEWLCTVSIRTVMVDFKKMFSVGCVGVPFSEVTATNQNKSKSEDTIFSSLKSEKNGLPVCLYPALMTTENNVIHSIPEHAAMSNDIFTDSLSNAYFIFLEYIGSLSKSNHYFFFWPTNNNLDNKHRLMTSCVYEKLFSNVSAKNLVFWGVGPTSAGISIFDDSVYDCPFYENIISAYENITNRHVVRNIPKLIVQNVKEAVFKNSKWNYIFSIQRLYRDIFIPSLHEIDAELRNELVIYALTTLSADLASHLETIPCIPVMRDKIRLEAPKNLKDPILSLKLAQKGKLSSVEETDGLWDTDRLEFICSIRLKIKKANEVSKMLNQIMHNITLNVECPKSIRQTICLAPIIPVKNIANLQCPDFVSSNQAFLPVYEYCISRVVPVVDLELVPALKNVELTNFLYLNLNVPSPEMVIQNLLELKKIAQSNIPSSVDPVEQEADRIYAFLAASYNPSLFDKLKDTPWVYFKGEFLLPQCLLFTGRVTSFPPFIYNVVGSYLTKYKDFLLNFNIKTNFGDQDYLQVLRSVEASGQKLTKNKLEHVVRFISELVNELILLRIDPVEYQIVNGPIPLPDTTGHLVPSSCILFDDCPRIYHSSNPLLHKMIHLSIANSLGVKKKSADIFQLEMFSCAVPRGLINLKSKSETQHFIVFLKRLMSYFAQMKCSNIFVRLDCRNHFPENFLDDCGKLLDPCLYFRVNRVITDPQITDFLEKLKLTQIHNQEKTGLSCSLELFHFVSVYSVDGNDWSFFTIEYLFKDGEITSRVIKKYKNTALLNKYYPKLLDIFDIGLPCTFPTTFIRFRLNSDENIQMVRIALDEFRDIVVEKIILMEPIQVVSVDCIDIDGNLSDLYSVSATFNTPDSKSYERYCSRLSKDRNEYYSGNRSLISKDYCTYAVSVTLTNQRISNYSWLCCSMHGTDSKVYSKHTNQQNRNESFPHINVGVNYETNYCQIKNSSLSPARILIGGMTVDEDFEATYLGSEKMTALSLTVDAYLLIMDEIRTRVCLMSDLTRDYWRYFPTVDNCYFVDDDCTEEFLSDFYNFLVDSVAYFPYLNQERKQVEFISSRALFFYDLNQNLDNFSILQNSLDSWGVHLINVTSCMKNDLPKKILQNRCFTFENILKYFEKYPEMPVLDLSSENKIVTDLSNILNYFISQSQCKVDLCGTPFMFTADSTMQIADYQMPKYLFEYNELFGDCQNMFVHSKMLEIYTNPKFRFSKIFREFDPEDLSLCLLKKHERSGTSPFSTDELLTMWNIIDCVFIDYSKKVDVNDKDALINLFTAEFRNIDRLPIVPVLIKNLDNKMEKHFLSISDHSEIFIIPEETNESVKEFIENSGISQLAKPCSDLWSFSQLVHSVDDLSYFENFLKLIERSTPTYQQLVPLLGHISYLLSLAKKEDCDQARTLLLGHAIFPLFDGSICMLGKRLAYIYSGTDIPATESSTWCCSSEVALLGFELFHFQPLLKILNCIDVSKATVYVKMILPNFPKMFPSTQMEHLSYITNFLLNGQVSDEEKALIDSTPLIYDQHKQLRRPSELFVSDNEHYKRVSTLLPSMHFPNEEYCNSSVVLEKFPIRGKLSSENVLFLISTVSCMLNQTHFDHEEMIELSKSAFYCCLDFCTEQDINKISTFEFILSDINSPFDLFSSNTQPTPMCLRGSVLSSRGSICWTECPILPHWIFPTSQTRTFLTLAGVQFDVLPTTVVKNLSNIANNIESTQNENIFANLIPIIYDNFSYLSKSELDSDCVETLCGLQIIPTNSGSFLNPKMVFFNINQTSEIPFLMETLNYIFYDLKTILNIIGVANLPDIDTFIKINKQFAEKQDQSPLNANELRFIMQSTKGLLMELVRRPTQSIRNITEDLFLPCRTGVLLASSKVVFPDNCDLLSRICGVDSFLLVSHSECQMDDDSFTDAIGRIPEQWRPKLLSHVAKEIIDSSCLNLKPKSADELFPATVRIRLRDDSFHSGVSRLMIAAAYESNYTISAEQIELFLDRICSVEIIPLFYITTYLLFDKEIIPESEHQCDCFYQPPNTARPSGVIYVKNRVSSENRALMTISTILDRICNGYLACQKDRLVHILSCPSYEITRELDSLLVPTEEESLCLPSVLPSPGTPIPSSQHGYLYANQRQFHVDEYVGYMKGQKSVVYGKIILDCNPVTQDLYKLKIGPLSTDVAHVSVQNLFKIFRSTQPSDFTLPEETRQEHDFDEQTTNDVFPSEESVPSTYFNSLHQEVKGGGDSDIKNMKFIQEYVKVECEIKNQISDLKQKSLEERKKNIKKLMLRWHPDKNPNDTELSTAVFKLINSEVETSCLFDESKKNVWEFMGHSDWDSFYDSIRKKAKEKESSTPSKETSEPPKKTSAQSKETWKPSSQASETSKETSTTDEPVEEEKSQMWMRQAKADLETAACLDFSRTGSFEWMAFIACQVCLS